jgi:hypothetical protein
MKLLNSFDRGHDRIDDHDHDQIDDHDHDRITYRQHQCDPSQHLAQAFPIIVVIVNYVYLCKKIMPSNFGGQIRAILAQA